MLLRDLQALAAEPEDTINAYDPRCPVADDLAEDLCEHLRIVTETCLEEGLITAQQLANIRLVDELLDRMSDRHDPELWTDEALRTRKEWSEVRALARKALASLGYDLEPPPRWSM